MHRNVLHSSALLHRHFLSLSFIIGLVISTTFAPNAVDEHLQKQEDESSSVSKEQQVKGALQMAQIQNHDAVSVLQ